MGSGDREVSVEKEFGLRSLSYNNASSWSADRSFLGEMFALICDEHPNVILDIGAGTGNLAAYIEEAGFDGKLRLVDLSNEMKQRYVGKGEYRIIDVEKELDKLMLTDVDVVVLRQVLHYIMDENRLLKYLSESLSRGASVIVGQFVFMEEEDARVMESVSKILSTNRRRSYSIGHMVHLVENAGFTLKKAVCLPWFDSVERWVLRAGHVLGRQEIEQVKRSIKGKTKALRAESVEGDVVYRLLFGNLLFKKE